MSRWKIAWRSIQQRSLASSLTGLSMALGVALVVAVLVAHAVIAESFRSNASLGYNLIVGAKGGKLQLVLNTVYYLSSPVENIPYSYYQEFVQPDGRFKPYVAKAIPVCLGDYYQSYRVIGTTPAMFDDFEYSQGKKYEFAAGRNFQHEHFFEAVVGSAVARAAGLTVGSTVQPSHGARADEGAHVHEDQFRVVGILRPTGTPNDRAVFVNMEGFYLLENHARPVEEKAESGKPKAEQAEAHEHDHEHENQKMADDKERAGHDHEHEAAHDKDHDHADHDHADHDHAGHDHQPLPLAQREVTAVLVRTSNDLVMLGMLKEINKGQVAQAVMPVSEITSLFESFVSPMQWVLLGLTVLVVVVAGIGVLVSIYNSMSDRRHEIAVMRALGAGRGTVLVIVLLESILLAVLGGAAGWLLGHALVAALSGPIYETTGVSLGFLQFSPLELYIIPGLVLLAAAVGFLPALVAYRTDVAKALQSTP